MRRRALAIFLWTVAAHAFAAGPIDPAKFRLSADLLDRMEAVNGEVNSASSTDEKFDENPETVEELARQLDSNPRVRAALLKHKVSSSDYAAAVFAGMHAGMHLATESIADKKKLATSMASYTSEQRANIELLRRRKK